MRTRAQIYDQASMYAGGHLGALGAVLPTSPLVWAIAAGAAVIGLKGSSKSVRRLALLAAIGAGVGAQLYFKG